ncbi:MAG: hypothetical protein QOK37_1620 [Thermoanaerobaculia bacterium]|nr:hypothetical protein [Thermoanaerobaculia bacterium]
MSTYEIYFFGLICHVSPDRNSPMKKSHATIVKAKKHGAMIAIDGGASAALTSKEISFSANATYIDASQDASDHLPHLKPPLIYAGTPDLKPEVKQKKPHKNVLTYVHYPDSTSAKILQIAHMYAYQAKYSTANVPVMDLCLARLLVLSVEQASPLTVDYGSGAVPITKWALIFNSATKKSAKDFKSYKDITDASGICDVGEDSTHNCLNTVTEYGLYKEDVKKYIDDLATKKLVLDSTDLECANSHWP